MGSKRIGVALSDELGIIATPDGVVPRRSYNKDAEAIEQIVQSTGAQAIVVGHPVTLAGGASRQTRRTEQFAEALTARVSVPVLLWDERLTTAMAHRLGFAHRDDEIAAALILQSYLDSAQRTHADPSDPPPAPDLP